MQKQGIVIRQYKLDTSWKLE